jgi:hypothetical protein
LFADFLSLPQGSSIVHSFFTRAKCFSVAGRNILSESGFSEYVAILKACQTDDCGDVGGRLAILEGELPGENRKRVSACWLPGHCGLLCSLLFEQVGLLATAGVAVARFSEIAQLQPALVNVALLWECFRTSAIVSLLLAAGKQDKRPTNDAARVAGPGRVCFLALIRMPLTFSFVFCSPTG